MPEKGLELVSDHPAGGNGAVTSTNQNDAVVASTTSHAAASNITASEGGINPEAIVEPAATNNRLAEALERLHEEIGVDQELLVQAAYKRTLVQAFGIPIFLVSLVYLATKAPFIYYSIGLADKFSAQMRVLHLGLIQLFIVAPVYYFLFHKRFVEATERLNKKEESYIAMRLSTIDGRKEYFREQLFALSSKASRVFFGDERRFDEASGWITQAGNTLDEAKSTAALSTVQGYLNSLSELVSREEREQKEERYWQYAAIGIMIVYVIALVFSARIDFGNPPFLFGIPVSVILWGAAGSLAAILYRFYTEQGQIRFATEFRWLIARPIIGIIMGGVVYIALSSGLVLLTTSGGNPTGTATLHKEAFWIVAFLAGFSDKFYLGVIDLLVARTVKSEEKDQNTKIMKTQRIPETDG